MVDEAQRIAENIMNVEEFQDNSKNEIKDIKNLKKRYKGTKQGFDSEEP